MLRIQVFVISLLISTCLALHPRQFSSLIPRHDSSSPLVTRQGVSAEQQYLDAYLPFIIELFGLQIGMFPPGTSVTVTSNGTHWNG